MTEHKITQKKVLLADDEVVSRRVLERFLAKWDFQVEVASNGTEAWQILQKEDSPRLAVLDWMMPGLEGVQICRQIRARVGRPYVYLLLLSARTQRKDVLAGLRAGADDYLKKPFDSEELHARLQVGQRIIELQDDLIRAREELRYQATHDALTGIANRGEILEVLGGEMNRRRRLGGCLGIILADLDHFKAINDMCGHAAGDAVLREAAQRMASSVRSYDTVGRYGGEEFLIIVPSSDGAGTLGLAERIRAAFESRLFQVGNNQLRVTVSLGVAACTAESPLEIQVLLHAADAALYRAKENGRNCVELANSAETSSKSALVVDQPVSSPPVKTS